MTRRDVADVRADDEDQMYPILSTVDRGARMTQLLEGRPVGRFTARLFARALICAATWALASSPLCAAYLGLAPTSVGSIWAAVASLVVAYVALCLTIGLSAESRTTFGQARFSGVLTSAVVCCGFAGSAGGWLIASLAIEPQPAFDLRNIATSPTFPRELLAVVGAAVALWAAVALARLGPARRHALSRQQTIDRLRRTGTRHAGEISELNFLNTWRVNDPIFRIHVAYTAQGENRVVPVQMRTSPTRVPVVGTPMVVFTEAGSVHVELDHSASIEFEDEGRYSPPDG